MRYIEMSFKEKLCIDNFLKACYNENERNKERMDRIMKKLLVFLLILCLTMSTFAFVSCDTPEQGRDTTDETALETVSIATPTNAPEDIVVTSSAHGDEIEYEATESPDGIYGCIVIENCGDDLYDELGGEASVAYDEINTSDIRPDDTDSKTETEELTEVVTDEPFGYSDTYLGKTPAEIYAEAYERLHAQEVNFIVNGSSVLSNPDNVCLSSRIFHALIDKNQSYCNFTLDRHDSTKRRSEYYYIYGEHIYSYISAYNIRQITPITENEAVSAVLDIRENILEYIFDLDPEHLANSEFIVTQHYATTHIYLETDQLKPLIGGQYPDAQKFRCQITATFDGEGNFASYYLYLTISMSDDTSGNDFLSFDYEASFSNIGTTVVPEPYYDDFITKDESTETDSDGPYVEIPTEAPTTEETEIFTEEWIGPVI